MEREEEGKRKEDRHQTMKMEQIYGYSIAKKIKIKGKKKLYLKNSYLQRACRKIVSQYQKKEGYFKKKKGFDSIGTRDA